MSSLCYHASTQEHINVSELKATVHTTYYIYVLSVYPQFSSTSALVQKY